MTEPARSQEGTTLAVKTLAVVVGCTLAGYTLAAEHSLQCSVHFLQVPSPNQSLSFPQYKLALELSKQYPFHALHRASDYPPLLHLFPHLPDRLQQAARSHRDCEAVGHVRRGGCRRHVLRQQHSLHLCASWKKL